VRTGYALTTYGGAMYFDAPSVTISRCCGNACYSDDYGSFIAIVDDGSHRFGDTSIVSSETKNHDGTIYVEMDDETCSLELRGMNFTSCYAKNTGSALKVSGTGDQFTSSYLILFSLTGDTGIDSYCEKDSSIAFSNIYNNTMNPSWGVLYCHGWGFTVSDSIFFGNSREFVMDRDNANRQFTILNCIFDDDFPSSNWVTIGPGNSAFSITISHAISMIGRVCEERGKRSGD
jgi:hypothetical protein